MSGSENKSFSLGDLAEAVGLPRRTVRYYVARGLLAGPVKAGRNAEYSDEHLERLHEIQRLQGEGHTLAEIGRRLAGGMPRVALPEPVATYSYTIAEDVSVQVKGDVSPWRMKQIHEALQELSERLGREKEADDDRNDRGD